MSNAGEFVYLLNKEMESLVDNYAKRRITDLEAKLAECEKEIKYYANRNVELLDESLNLTRVNNTYFDENKKLKQQLAEKDAELEEVKKSKTYIMNFGGKVKEVQVVDDNQDKISFCVEKLQEVKEIINKNYFYNMSSDSCTFDKLEVDFQIDNQIASLKKGVE